MNVRALVLLLVAGCAADLDVEPLGDYTQWKRIDVTGPAPGHGNTYRVIYADPLAADPAWPLRLGYQDGSILVKEIRDNVDGQPGDLQYVAIMRRTKPIVTALEAQGGWLYTESDEPGGPEIEPSFCWNRCHVAAPYNGAWYDYRR
ncbi:MAG: cytochrome P460 family protein [Kofleriaceae bacterium]